MTRIITFGGGKGGTGKSLLATNVATYLSKKGYSVLVIDADVESPVTHILLQIDRIKKEEIVGFVPKINEEKCVGCGICINKCPENALIGRKGEKPILLENLCEGCGLCRLVCPVNAIESKRKKLGEIYEGKRNNISLIQGEVFPGVRQHVNVTLGALKYAKKKLAGFDFVVIDSAPGTGANIWLTINISDLVVAVTEPTPLGANDLRKYIELVAKYKKPIIIALNKANIPGGSKEQIYNIASTNNLDVVEIVYDRAIIEAYINAKQIIEVASDSEAALGIKRLGERILERIAYK